MGNTQQQTTEGIELPPYPDVSLPLYTPRVLTAQDFLTQVEKTLGEIGTLKGNIPTITILHFQVLKTRSTGRERAHQTLLHENDNVSTMIQAIHDHLRALKADAEETTEAGGFNFKYNQTMALVTWFKSEIIRYSREEASYRHNLRERLTRQYLILNPKATTDEAQGAADRDWSVDETF